MEFASLMHNFSFFLSHITNQGIDDDLTSAI